MSDGVHFRMKASDSFIIPLIFGEACLMYIKDCLLDGIQPFEIWNSEGETRHTPPIHMFGKQVLVILVQSALPALLQ